MILQRHTIKEPTLVKPASAFRPVAVTLHLEGLAAALIAGTTFAQTGGSWWLFALLILAPDLAMLGYLAGKAVGAVCYNIAHSYLAPVVLGAAAFAVGHPTLLHIALIWVVHIGLDRAIGYGLKYSSGFKDTHLARV